jgi:phosphoribosylaminoimidazole (AIR) synthetase
MGIGMILVVSPRDVAKVTALLKNTKEKFYQIGLVARGKGRVVFH